MIPEGAALLELLEQRGIEQAFERLVDQFRDSPKHPLTRLAVDEKISDLLSALVAPQCSSTATGGVCQCVSQHSAMS